MANFRKIRYIKDSLQGSSTTDANSHWVQIAAFTVNGDKTTLNNATHNAAFNKTVTGTGLVHGSYITNGNITSSNYGYIIGSGTCTVDLSAEYDITKIQVWHYYSDNRMYKDHALQVAGNDGQYKWVTKRESLKPSDSDGKSYYLYSTLNDYEFIGSGEDASAQFNFGELIESLRDAVNDLQVDRGVTETTFAGSLTDTDIRSDINEIYTALNNTWNVTLSPVYSGNEIKYSDFNELMTTYDDINNGTTTCKSGCTNICTLGCKTGCTTSCAVGCGGSCQSSCGSDCAGGCSTSCAIGCGSGCAGGCSKACSATCGGACAIGCGGACNWGCSVACSPSCWAWAQNCLACTGTCDGFCGGYCFDACSSSCGTACAGGCSTECAGGCYSNCYVSCGDACAGGCRVSCAKSCGGACDSSCGAACSGGCGNSCSNTCGSACAWGCSTGCSGACSSTCSTLCSTSCSYQVS